MSTMEIRQKLFEYIRDAEDRKVKAMYAIIENEMGSDEDVWTDEFLMEMQARTSEFENGEIKGSTWEQLKIRTNNYKRLSDS